MSLVHDLIIVGGGPVGLALAIEARKRGLDVVVIERARGPVDKACGEGLMPSGVRWLEENGVRVRLGAEDCAGFAGIRYIEETGTIASGLLPGSGGLGIRRLALSRALRDEALSRGLVLLESTTVRSHERRTDEVQVNTDSGAHIARLLVGADGLHSAIRSDAGVVVEQGKDARRYGIRQHFALPPWSTHVEVHFARNVEAYVTPVGQNNVGVAFLWTRGERDEHSYEELLSLFPALKSRLASATPSSPIRGAGPLLQRVTRPVADRLVLIGDAAGYVDALTGEGLTLGFECARRLGEELPSILSAGCTVASMRRYERDYRRLFDRYAWLTHSLLAVARRPTLRRAMLKLLALSPGLFDAALAEAMP